MLLEKVDEQDTDDYTVNYKTIGRQNGTLRLKKVYIMLRVPNVAYDSARFDKIFRDTERGRNACN